MEFLSHRGLWRAPQERNTPQAFQAAFFAGFGIETDLRDLAQTLVISHDPPQSALYTLDQLLHLHAAQLPKATLAINVKSDGLTPLLLSALEKISPQSYFVFDMSIPDTIPYLNAAVPVFTRQSEYEPNPVFYDQASGIWLDAFNSDWVTPHVIAAHLQAHKKVCLVSPELHRRDHRPFWDRLASLPDLKSPNLMLCTDLPLQAQQYFGAQS